MTGSGPAAPGRPGTGNAVRPSLKAPPGVGFTNLHIAPDDGDQADLVGRMNNGLIISYIMGAHTADPVTGEFSLGASGHLVQKGRIMRPVKSIAIAGQILDLFNKVEAVGADPAHVRPQRLTHLAGKGHFRQRTLNRALLSGADLG